MSSVIRRALRETNAKDYPRRVVEGVASRYAAQRIAKWIATRQVLVAVERGAVVGTASLEGGTVQAVYVAPEHQGAGIGRALMAALERLARADGVQLLHVSSTITAEGFYRKLGFVPVGRSVPGENGLILLNKRLLDRVYEPGRADQGVCIPAPASL